MLYRWQPPEQFIWTADSNNVQQQYSAKKQQHYQFSSIYVSNFLSSACANTTADLTDEVQHVKPAACLSRRLDTFFFLHRYAAQWIAVAVAPIMNSLLHLNTEYFHYISVVSIMRAGGKLAAGLCNSMVSTALFSIGLCLGAWLSVWSSCVGLDTGVQVKWLLALMESPHLPDVYFSSAYCYSWHYDKYQADAPRNVEAFPRTVFSWLPNVSLLWQWWLHKHMHAKWLKMTEEDFEAIMSWWILTKGSSSKTKVIQDTGKNLMACKSNFIL